MLPQMGGGGSSLQGLATQTFQKPLAQSWRLHLGSVDQEEGLRRKRLDCLGEDLHLTATAAPRNRL